MSASDQEYLAYQTNRGFLRRLVRRFYLKKIASHCRGSVIDYGCGAGELLEYLSQDSIGLEVNKAAVDYCSQKSLKVFEIDHSLPSRTLAPFINENFRTIVFNHVLEHIPQPEIFFKSLIETLAITNISRLIIVSPGEKGFSSDKTHQVFIDTNWFNDYAFLQRPELKVAASYYFPINLNYAGRFFTHNEWHLIIDFVKNEA